MLADDRAEEPPPPEPDELVPEAPAEEDRADDAEKALVEEMRLEVEEPPPELEESVDADDTGQQQSTPDVEVADALDGPLFEAELLEFMSQKRQPRTSEGPACAQ